jgi:predicted RNA-binding protein Jag
VRTYEKHFTVLKRKKEGFLGKLHKNPASVEVLMT